MVEDICKLKSTLKKEKPLIHCITNPISIHQCANAILSVGAKPIMAEHPKEVFEITDTCDGLMLNMGNITDARMESMLLSAERANEREIPILLDVVGVACSKFRRDYVLELLRCHKIWVIKGNYSEIKALEEEGYGSLGVDADPSIDVGSMKKIASKLAKKYSAVILATGKIDVITDGTKMISVKNGTPSLALVTGTGCMLGALCTSFMTSVPPMEASVFACCYFGICGELSETTDGVGSFMVHLMNRLSTLGREELEHYLDVEEELYELFEHKTLSDNRQYK